MSELSREQLEELLARAHVVAVWAGQGTIDRKAAGAKHLYQALWEYRKARIDTYAAIRPLTVSDIGGCTCTRCDSPDFDNCMYHYGAALQPDNHRIPWNCPTYYDGCNCKEAG